jgi:serine protease inhibitor ecotin
MAFTMACPNFKKGLKMVSGPLGVKVYALFRTRAPFMLPRLI